MKKSEMAAIADEYERRMRVARAASSDGDFAGAIREATAAWDMVDAVLRLERAESREPASIDAFDLVFEYAPPALDFRTLDRLEQFLAENRRLARHGDGQLTENLAAARTRLWDCHRLWSEIDREPGLLQSTLPHRLGKTARHWDAIVHAWDKMGLVDRTRDGSSFRLSLATRLGQIVSAKCPKCGKREEAPKAMLLDHVMCPKCRTDVSFVILGAGNN